MHQTLRTLARLAFGLLPILAAAPAGALDPGRMPALTTPHIDLGGGITCISGSLCDASGLSVTPQGAPAGESLAKILGRTFQVENFRLPADGSDWGPAFARARSAAQATGGVLRVSTPGLLTIATATGFPKGNPYILLRCDSQATVLANAASLTGAMFTVGGPSPNGNGNVDVEGCSFRGANTTASTAFSLTNANGMVFRGVSFDTFATAVASAAGFAITFEDVSSNNVTYTFRSSTSAHNFVSRRGKAFGGTTVYRFDGRTDNISITEGDFEGVVTGVQTVGGTSLRFVGNYIEYQTGSPIYNTGPMYGADISNNWIALGNPWVLTHFVGGQLKGNGVYNQSIGFDPATTRDIEVGDNNTGGTASVQPTPYQSPTLINGWAQQTNHSAVGFRKGRDGRVHLRGALVNPGQNLGTSAFTLPAGYRPGSERTFIAGNSSYAITQIAINGNGGVRIIAVGNAGAGTAGNPYQAGLDGISFEPGT